MSVPPLWRIGTETASYTADDVAGKGAESTGGRWNRKGTPVCYLSTTRALACLETLVHLPGGRTPLPLNRYLVRITVPDAAWDARTVFDPTTCVAWDAEPAGVASHTWGEEWLRGATTLLAEVPSVIIPEESNVLLNPRHPDAARVTAAAVRQWRYDPRLLWRPKPAPPDARGAPTKLLNP